MRHIVSIDIAAEADVVFAYVRDARNLTHWTLGGMRPLELNQTHCVSHSLLTGIILEITVNSNAQQRSVEFICQTPARGHALIISARVVPTEDGCKFSLEVERPANFDGPAWRLTCAAHEVEVHILRTLLQAEMPNNNGSV